MQSPFWCIYAFYLKYGFIITTVHADGEFSPVQELISEMLSRTMVNLTSANKPVPKIKQQIWVVKQKCRSTRNSLPFISLPVMLTINILLNNVKLLGYFSTTAVILKNISPKYIITGKTLNYKSNLEINFVQYCQIHKEDTPCNITKSKTRGAICMSPSGNKQGGFKFMTLGSMKKVTRKFWDRIMIPDTAIAQVDTLGQVQPNYLQLLVLKKLPIGELNTTGVDAGETEAPNV